MGSLQFSSDVQGERAERLTYICLDTKVVHLCPGAVQSQDESKNGHPSYLSRNFELAYGR